MFKFNPRINYLFLEVMILWIIRGKKLTASCSWTYVQISVTFYYFYFQCLCMLWVSALNKYSMKYYSIWVYWNYSIVLYYICILVYENGWVEVPEKIFKTLHALSKPHSRLSAPMLRVYLKNIYVIIIGRILFFKFNFTDTIKLIYWIS